MAKLSNEPLLDRDTLRRLDVEVTRAAADGTWPNVRPPDPASDPFGSGYDWLDLPKAEGEFSRAYISLAASPSADWYRLAARPVRDLFLSDTFAGGPDEAVLRAWARDQFEVLCGPTARDVHRQASAASHSTAELAAAVLAVLDSHPPFARLPLEQRLATALVVLDSLKTV